MELVEKVDRAFKVGDRVYVDIPSYELDKTAQSVRRYNQLKMTVSAVRWVNVSNCKQPEYELKGAMSEKGHIPFKFVREWLRHVEDDREY